MAKQRLQETLIRSPMFHKFREKHRLSMITTDAFINPDRKRNFLSFMLKLAHLPLRQSGWNAVGLENQPYPSTNPCETTFTLGNRISQMSSNLGNEIYSVAYLQTTQQ